MAQVERYLTTSVALITTTGSLGPNVMAAEWTMQVSYDPMLIATFISPGEATHGQILETGEFGVGFCSDDQLALAAIAGGYTRRDVDKLTSDLFDTYPGTHIRAPLIRGCVATLECRLWAHHSVGDHTAFVGEVVAATFDEARQPMIRRGQGFYHVGGRIERPAVLYVMATPGDAPPGASLRIVGRAFAPPATGAVEIEVRDARGRPSTRATLTTNARGHFEGSLALPPDAAEGSCDVVASAEGLTGRARLQISAGGDGRPAAVGTSRPSDPGSAP